MNHISKRSILASIACICFGASLESAAADTVAVTVTTSHPRAPLATSTRHDCICADGTYSVEIQKGKNRVLLHFSGDQQSVADISSSAFGSALASRSLYGGVGFTCWNPGGVNIYFFGYELRPTGESAAVRSRASVRRDGTFTIDEGLQAEASQHVIMQLTR